MFFFPPVREIIHKLKLRDYLLVQADRPWWNYHFGPGFRYGHAQFFLFVIVLICFWQTINILHIFIASDDGRWLCLCTGIIRHLRLSQYNIMFGHCSWCFYHLSLSTCKTDRMATLPFLEIFSFSVRFNSAGGGFHQFEARGNNLLLLGFPYQGNKQETTNNFFI